MFGKHLAMGRHPARGGAALKPRPAVDPGVPSRSCCCPARPVVKIVMPPADDRNHPVDLWLCGHHYRASRAALLLADAEVTDLPAPHTTGDVLARAV
jgi:hypothetical protein